MQDKWDQLIFILLTAEGERELHIQSNFQESDGGWFDPGKYTVKEAEKYLGNFHVDLYTNDGILWDGDPTEFTDEQQKQIVNYIIFHDVKDIDNPF